MISTKDRQYPPVPRPGSFRQDADFLRLKGLAKELEREAGDGAEVGGTGLTVLKYDRPPLVYLFEAKPVVDGKPNPKKINTEELRAADDIQTAYFSMTKGLLIATQSYEKTDRTNSNFEPHAVIDAVKRYRAWANFWSARAKWGDKTLRIVIDAVCDRRPFWTIDEKCGIRKGHSSLVVATALRDYLARAGWADPKQAKGWMEAAESNFVLRKAKL